MVRLHLFSVGLLFVTAACGDDGNEIGGGDASESAPSDEATSDGGAPDDEQPDGADDSEVADPQLPGRAIVSVEGREFTLTEPGALDCTVTEDAVTFSFRIGDNEVTLGGGADHSDDVWLGSVEVRIADPGGEPGPITYFVTLPDESSGLAVDGDSFSYTGPLKKQPSNDGSNPVPVDAGLGLVSLTCP